MCVPLLAVIHSREAADGLFIALVSLQWRNAAIQEALSEDPIHTERAYDTAVYLFKAILDDTIRDGQLMEEEDRMSVEKCACGFAIVMIEAQD